MEDARGLLLAAHRAQSPDTFIWIAADGWGKEMKLVENVEAVALGAITVELQSEPIKEFDEYFRQRRYISPAYPLGRLHVSGQRQRSPTMAELIEQSDRNPWFNEYWEEVFQCSLPDSAYDQYQQDSPAMPNEHTVRMYSNQTDDDERDDLHVPYLYSSSSKDFDWPIMSLHDELMADERLLRLLQQSQRPIRRFLRRTSQSMHLVSLIIIVRLLMRCFWFLRSSPFTFRRDSTTEYASTCDPKLSLAHVHHKQEPKIQFVVDAVYAFAHALHNAWLEKCNGRGKICAALREMDGGEFYHKYLLNVSFLGKQSCRE